MLIQFSLSVSSLPEEVLESAIEHLNGLEGLSDSSMIVLGDNIIALETGPNSYLLKTMAE